VHAAWSQRLARTREPRAQLFEQPRHSRRPLSPRTEHELTLAGGRALEADELQL
jgi:hypothetical protein